MNDYDRSVIRQRVAQLDDKSLANELANLKTGAFMATKLSAVTYIIEQIEREQAIRRFPPTVTISRTAGADGAWIVQIDTGFEPDGSDEGPGLRVFINDDDTYVGVPFDFVGA